ncbi:MAG TPA: hypothetical protein VFQ89_09065, partial [Candidatus Binatia bacterium]|nr:hypothetical protein [Candidatus Binatia bacterium]
LEAKNLGDLTRKPVLLSQVWKPEHKADFLGKSAGRVTFTSRAFVPDYPALVHAVYWSDRQSVIDQRSSIKSASSFLVKDDR